MIRGNLWIVQKKENVKSYRDSEGSFAIDLKKHKTTPKDKLYTLLPEFLEDDE